MSVLEAFLVALLVAEQAISFYFINKLVNKIMSRNYAEYEQAQIKPERQRFRVPLEDEPEDLRNIESPYVG